MSIEGLRKKIDNIDEEIVELLEQRFKTSMEISREKRKRKT